MTLDRYFAYRRRYEVLAWLGFFLIQTTGNVVVVLLDIDRAGLDIAAWEVVVWESSSNLVLLALIPVMLLFDTRFPLQRDTWRRNLPRHLAFTLVWSLAHVLAMIALRKLAYDWAGGNYVFSTGAWNFLVEFFYEYIKDVRAYAGFLAVIYLYRFVLRRLQGEASFVPEGDTQTETVSRDASRATEVPDRFLVKKLGREFLVRVKDIDWIESAGNYVTLHVGARLYPLRETMSGIEQKLGAHGFVRVHRSAILNLDRVKEIEPFDTGDARAHLVDGSTVAVSRRYRGGLKDRLA